MPWKVLPDLARLLKNSARVIAREVRVLIDGLRPAALLPIHCAAEDREEFFPLHKNCLMLIFSKK